MSLSNAVAELPGPHAELVAGIDRGEGVAARQGAVAGKELGELGAAQFGRIKPDQPGDFRAGRHQVGAGQGFGVEAGVEMGWQAREGVVEGQGFEGMHGGLVVGLALLGSGNLPVGDRLSCGPGRGRRHP